MLDFVVDEFDPFTNEISNIDYNFLPTIAHIRKNPDTLSPNKWIVHTKEEGFTNREIIDFVISHSQFQLNVNSTAVPENVDKEEVKHPIFPILKTRLDAKFLSENSVNFEIPYFKVLPKYTKKQHFNLQTSWYGFFNLPIIPNVSFGLAAGDDGYISADSACH